MTNGIYDPNSSDMCAPGTCGAYCQLCCEEDYYFDYLKTKCAGCGNSKMYVGISLGVTAVLAIGLPLIWQFTGLGACLMQLWLWQRVALFLHTVGLRSKIKIIVSQTDSASILVGCSDLVAPRCDDQTFATRVHTSFEYA